MCSYAKQFAEFPHDTKLDQFFWESQFESYRGLGFYIMDMISSPEDGTSPPNLADLIR